MLWHSTMRWLHFFLVGWGLPLSLYVVLQTAVLLCLRGRWRIAAASPVPFMLLVSGHTIWAYVQGNRLWPLLMLMAAPGASVTIIVVWMLELAISRRVRCLLVLVSLCAASLSAAALGGSGLRILWSGRWTVATAATLLALAAVASQFSDGPGPSRPRDAQDR